MGESSQRLFVGQHPWQRENMERNGEALAALADRLLAIGGETVIVPSDNPDLVEVELALLLREGRRHDPATATLEWGDASECHANAVDLWQAGRGSICTGYALSNSRWRSHSWVNSSDGGMIETTELRDVYSGYELDDEGAATFAGLV
jgi:hypothetical protein